MHLAEFPWVEKFLHDEGVLNFCDKWVIAALAVGAIGLDCGWAPWLTWGLVGFCIGSAWSYGAGVAWVVGHYKVTPKP